MAKKAASSTAKKRKVSGKRGSPSRKAQQPKSVDPRGVIGVVVLCLGFLSLFSQFIPSQGGFLQSCTTLTRGLGGSLCLLLPAVVCWAGVVLVFFSEGQMKVRPLVCGALIFLIVETAFQLFKIDVVQSFVVADNAKMSYGEFLAQSYGMASRGGGGGGLIGALLAWPLFKALDVWGAMVVLIFAMAVVLMVLTGVSFAGVGMRVSEWVDDFRADMTERREEKEALRAAEEEEALERERELALERKKKQKEKEKAEKEAARREAEEQKKKQKEEKEAKEAEAEEAPEEAAENEAAEEPAEPEQTEEPEPPKKPVKKKMTKKDMEDEIDALIESVKEDAAKEEPSRPERRKNESRPPRKPRNAHYRDISPKAKLYIERDDEFTRDTLDERGRKHSPRTRTGFTLEEAEEAFLHGMSTSPENRPYGQYTSRLSPVQSQEELRETLKAKAEEEARRKALEAEEQEASQKEEAAPEAENGVQEEAPFEDAPLNEAPEEADFIQAEDGEPEELLDVEAVPAFHQEPAEEEPDEDEPDVLTSASAPASRFDEDDEEAEEDDDVFSGASFGGWRAESRSETAKPSGNMQESPLAKSIRAAQEREKKPPMTQNVLAAQKQPPQPIVQLRGNRLDGTPLVMPAKPIHEEPKVTVEEYIRPPIDLLNVNRVAQDPNQRAKDEAGAQKLLATLESFGVQAKLIHVTHGPAITRYELQPAPGVKVSRIVNLVDDIALNMASDGVRIEAPIPGKPAVGIEIPNRKTEMVGLRDVLESPEMGREKSPTAVALGKSVSGAPVVVDVAKMPHVLIAGATGSGKSVCINTIINSVIFRASPKEVRMILIDPKVVELSVYNGIPHLLVPVVTDPKKASAALSWAVVEMEHRYKRFETMGVRDIRGYNAAIGPNEEPMSKIIVIIDELADLMMVAPGEVEESICRLAQLARAAGIHLVIATQRPSVNVITGVIKANIPTRIAFAVSSQIDSRTILDTGGAEKLLGKGDMLYAPQGAGKPTRVQGCFVSDDEVQRVVDFVRGKHEADYNEDVIEQMDAAADEEKASSGDAPSTSEPVDEMLPRAIELAVEAGQVSISMLQRRLRVGYARAGRLVDEMTLRGITAEAEGPTKPRTVLISRDEWRKMQENQE